MNKFVAIFFPASSNVLLHLNDIKILQLKNSNQDFFLHGSAFFSVVFYPPRCAAEEYQATELQRAEGDEPLKFAPGARSPPSPPMNPPWEHRQIHRTRHPPPSLRPSPTPSLLRTTPGWTISRQPFHPSPSPPPPPHTLYRHRPIHIQLEQHARGVCVRTTKDLLRPPPTLPNNSAQVFPRHPPFPPPFGSRHSHPGCGIPRVLTPAQTQATACLSPPSTLT